MRYMVLAIALGLAAPTLASEQTDRQQNEPVVMTEAQLDGVVGGQGCEAVVGCIAIDISNVLNDLNLQVGVNANAAVAILGEATSVQRGSGVVFTRP